MKNIVFVFFILHVFVRSSLRSIPMDISVVPWKWQPEGYGYEKTLVFYNISQRLEINSQKLSTLKNATITMENGSTVQKEIFVYQSSKVFFRLTSSYFRKTKNQTERGKVDIKLDSSNPVSSPKINEFNFQLQKEVPLKNLKSFENSALNFYYLSIEEDKKFMKISKDEMSIKCPNEVCSFSYIDFSDIPNDTQGTDVQKKTWNEKPQFNANLLIDDPAGREFKEILDIDSFKLELIRIQVQRDAPTSTGLPITIHNRNQHLIYIHLLIQVKELELKEEVKDVIEPSSSLEFLFQLPQGMASVTFSVSYYNSTDNATISLSPAHLQVEDEKYLVYPYKGTQVHVKKYWPITLCLLFVVVIGILISNRKYIKLRLLERQNNRYWRQQLKRIPYLQTFGSRYKYFDYKKMPKNKNRSKQEEELIGWVFSNHEYSKTFFCSMRYKFNQALKEWHYEKTKELADDTFLDFSYQRMVLVIRDSFIDQNGEQFLSDYLSIITQKQHNNLLFLYLKRTFFDCWIQVYVEILQNQCSQKQQFMIKKYDLVKYEQANLERRQARKSQLVREKRQIYKAYAELYRDKAIQIMGGHNATQLIKISRAQMKRAKQSQK